MKQNKQLFNRPGIVEEVQSLRSEQPDPMAIDRAVFRTLDASPRPIRRQSRLVWRFAAVAGLIVASSSALYLTAQPASAASLHDIAAVFGRQKTLHFVDERPDSNGNPVFRREFWLSGKKYAESSVEADGERLREGYDGSLRYRISSKNGGYVDDTKPMDMSVEDIDSYLDTPNAQVLRHATNLQLDGRTVDLYTIGFSNVKFDLYVDPSSHLPLRRDVFTPSGEFTERELYDYPVSMPDTLFSAPTGPEVQDYPQLRAILKSQLSGPGQTKEVGGVKISLKAVILGRDKVLALWTGGVKGEDVREGDMWIEGQERAPGTARPDIFSVTHRMVPGFAYQFPLTANGQEVLGDAAWLLEGGTNRHRYIEGPFTLNVPAWAEDRTRPIVDGKGSVIAYHSKLVGRLSFEVTDLILADDPDSVVWRRDQDEVTTAASGSGNTIHP